LGDTWHRIPISKKMNDNIETKTLKDGRVYTVRKSRDRFFFPDEWIRFKDACKKDKYPLFELLINTGARIDEALHVKLSHFDPDRKTLTLYTTKTKAKKGETQGKPRTLPVSGSLIRSMRKYAKENNIGEDSYLFTGSKVTWWQMMRRILIRAEIKNPKDFGLHNIRKTHGNWLKALEIPAEEICLRLGHDFNTYLKHYGSPNIFDRKDKQGMVNILGDVYGFK